MAMMTAKRTSRRQVLAIVAAGAGTVILAACGESASPTAAVAPTAAPTMAAKPTVAATTGAATTGSAAAGAATGAATIGAASAATTASTAASAPTAGAGSAAAPTTGTGMAAAPTTGTMMAAMNGKYPSPLDGVSDAYDTLPPPFKAVSMVPGKGSKVTLLHQYYNGAPPVPRDQNKYWQELEKRLGVTYEPTFVPGGSYDEKFAAVAASGDFPDIVFLGNTPAQIATIQQGAFTDLTSYLTGDGLKEFPNIATISPKLFKNLAVKGKIYGVPGSRSIVANPLIFRRDWMEAVKLPAPKNAEDFFNLMVAFTKNDPDGNGNADTYGLGSGNPTAGILCVSYFASMFRAPNTWRLNPDGTLTNQIETDEFKQALAYMNRLWTAGVYHPDAPTMTGTPLKDNFAGGKYGAYYDALTALQDGIAQQTLQVNPKAKVTALAPPGFDGGKAVTYNGPGWGYYLAIPSKVGKDVARTKELLRVIDYFCAPFGSDEWRFVNYGIDGVDNTTMPDGSLVRTQQGDREIGDFKRTANGPQSYYVPAVPGIAREMQQIAVQMVSVGIDNPTLGQFSPTNASKGSVLDQLFVDRVIAITTGREPISAVDQWIKDWRSRGGDQIRMEYQQALKGQ